MVEENKVVDSTMKVDIAHKKKIIDVQAAYKKYFFECTPDFVVS